MGSPAWCERRHRGRSQPRPPGHGAEAFGATDTLPTPLDADQNRYDVAIECVGSPGLLDQCIAATRAKGRIVVAGVCAEQDPFWSMAALMKELTIRFAVYYTPDEFRTVIERLSTRAPSTPARSSPVPADWSSLERCVPRSWPMAPREARS